MLVKSSFDLKIKKYGDVIRNTMDYDGYHGYYNLEFNARDSKLIFIGWFDGDNNLITRDNKISVNRPEKGDIYRIAKYLDNDTNQIVLDINHIFAFGEGYNKPMPGIFY